MNKFITALCLWLFTNAGQAIDLNPAKTIAPCISYQTSADTHIHIVRATLGCKSINMFSTPYELRGSTTSKFARKTNAIVAINGAFYKDKDQPNGLAISNFKRWPNTKDERINGFLSCTGSRCFIDEPDKLSLPRPEWSFAVSGWQLLKNGKYKCSIPSRTCINNAIFPHPRTIVGLSKNTLFLIVIEGRLDSFPGYTLIQAAKLTQQLGMHTAINLDGGSSSTMVINNQRVNRLSSAQLGFIERGVANHIGIGSVNSSSSQ